MKNLTKTLLIAAMAGAFPVLIGCDEKKPAKPLTTQLQDTKEPKQQVMLLREAQKRYGAKEGQP